MVSRSRKYSHEKQVSRKLLFIGNLWSPYDEDEVIGRNRARILRQQIGEKVAAQGRRIRLCACQGFVCARTSALDFLRNWLTQRPFVALSQRNAIAVQPFQER